MNNTIHAVCSNSLEENSSTITTLGGHSKGSLILMADGSIKTVESISVGDSLQGQFGPVKVKALRRGIQEAVRVVPRKGTTFIVNLDHKLTLQRTNDGTKNKFRHFDVSIRDWLSWNNNAKKCHLLARCPVEKFEKATSKLPIDPYHLGILLGDGGLIGQPSVYTTDPEIVEACDELAHMMNCSVRAEITENRCPAYFFRGKEGPNQLTASLRELGLAGTNSGNKFIPKIYKTASLENRAKLLAGCLDTDGSNAGGYYEYVSKSQRLAEDVAFVARSLGLAAYPKRVLKKGPNNYSGYYYRFFISGECSHLPVRISRKKVGARKQKKSVLRTRFTVDVLPNKEYYGFDVENNERYLLGDFTLNRG